MVENIVFAVCAVIALAGAFGVVISRNPVHSALSLVATLFAIAVLFLNLEAYLLAAVQVIVYTGAIVVLILFVMMLLGVDTDDDLDTEPIVGQRALAAISCFAVVGSILAVIIFDRSNLVTGARSSLEALATDIPDITQIGQQLFTTYVFALEATAALLTIAVVGAVVMARRRSDVGVLPDPDEAMPEPDDHIYVAVPIDVEPGHEPRPAPSAEDAEGSTDDGSAGEAGS